MQQFLHAASKDLEETNPHPFWDTLLGSLWVRLLQLGAQALLLTDLDPQLQGLVRGATGWGLPETGRSPGAGQGDAPWW